MAKLAWDPELHLEWGEGIWAGPLNTALCVLLYALVRSADHPEGSHLHVLLADLQPGDIQLLNNW